MTGRQARAILASLPGHVGAAVKVQMGLGRVLEAQRILARALGDGERAEEVIGSLIRAAVTGQ